MERLDSSIWDIKRSLLLSSLQNGPECAAWKLYLKRIVYRLFIVILHALQTRVTYDVVVGLSDKDLL